MYDDRELAEDMLDAQEARRGTDDLIMMIVIVAIVGGLIFAGAGWIDSHFHWGLTEKLNEFVQGLFHPKK